VGLLEDFLGRPKAHYPNKGQISFDCPTCSHEIKGLDEGDGKGNLEINYHKGVFKCWACSETHSTHGHINKIFYKWAKPSHRKMWDAVSPEEFKSKTKKYSKIELPYEYISFEKANKLTIPYREAINYLKKRKINDNVISKYSLGYTTEGLYRGRIIIPSFDDEGKVNYFVARSYINHRNKYKNPEFPKDEIIFNESKIDWSKDVYLVEGVFDMFFIENSIPILGKTVSDKLWGKLYDNCEGNIIICLDGDALKDAEKLYRKLDGGKLNHRIRLIKMPQNKDVAELGGIQELDPITLL
jgi:hypothetical protein|tara:strand:- start:866 stop:1759 length:894 start_codon:yes stop_codon:yes gene_type:complete